MHSACQRVPGLQLSVTPNAPFLHPLLARGLHILNQLPSQPWPLSSGQPQQQQQQQQAGRHRQLPPSLMMRLIDDFFIVTPSCAVAEAVTLRLLNGAPHDPAGMHTQR